MSKNPRPPPGKESMRGVLLVMLSASRNECDSNPRKLVGVIARREASLS